MKVGWGRKHGWVVTSESSYSESPTNKCWVARQVQEGKQQRIWMKMTV